MTTILAVDDDAQVLRAVRRVLEAAGYTVITASGGSEALEIVKRERPDLIVLDIIMPDMDGVEVCRRLRADPFYAKIPVLFLTAKSRATDAAAALDAGGDDFLSKPFEVVELPARIRALMRRAPGGTLDPESDYVQTGDLRLHATQPILKIGARTIQLTTLEHRLLFYLLRHAGQPVPVSDLLEAVWEYPPGTGNPKLVHVHVRNLRAKLGDSSDTPVYVRNVRGRGYIVEG